MVGGDVLIWLIVLMFTFGGLGAWVAGQKRRSAVEGVLLGGLFGPFGVLVLALMPTGDRLGPARRSGSLRSDVYLEPRFQAEPRPDVLDTIRRGPPVAEPPRKEESPFVVEED